MGSVIVAIYLYIKYCVGIVLCVCYVHAVHCASLPLFLDAPEATVLCRGKLYLVRDNYRDWPLSKITTMPLQGISHPQYTVTDQVQITDVQSLVSGDVLDSCNASCNGTGSTMTWRLRDGQQIVCMQDSLLEHLLSLQFLSLPVTLA